MTLAVWCLIGRGACVQVSAAASTTVEDCGSPLLQFLLYVWSPSSLFLLFQWSAVASLCHPLPSPLIRRHSASKTELVHPPLRMRHGFGVISRGLPLYLPVPCLTPFPHGTWRCLPAASLLTPLSAFRQGFAPLLPLLFLYSSPNA